MLTLLQEIKWLLFWTWLYSLSFNFGLLVIQFTAELLRPFHRCQVFWDILKYLHLTEILMDKKPHFHTFMVHILIVILK